MRKNATKRTLNEKHYGELIEKAVRRNSISITELCRRLAVSRRSLYNWFQKDYLDVNIIAKIGKALNYDFSEDFPELKLDTADNHLSKYQADLLHQNEDVSFWKNKYITLLETHHHLLTLDR